MLKKLLFAALMIAPILSASPAPAADPAGGAFPGAVGPAAATPGGRGGRIIRVTTLAPDGPGSFKAALEAKGPRIVVFEVGGVIDMGRNTLTITEPYLTIAGQTAPGPGITLIRTGIDVKTHDVIIRHLRVYTGVDAQPKRSGWEADALSTVGAYNVVVDHCTFLWAIDENMSASGPRFEGTTLAEWRKNTSHNITFSNNLAAEGLANASHPKGEHSKGSLVHDNTTGIVFYRNIWAHNVERAPLVKGGAQVLMINNLIYNPGHRAVHYNLMNLEWVGHDYVTGEISAIGNVMRGGNDTDEGLPFLMLGGDGDLQFYGEDNIAVDRHGNPLPEFGRYGETRAELVRAKAPLAPVAGYDILPARGVETSLLAAAGARPWARDAEEIRILFFIAEGRGDIIDDEKEVSAYPKVQPPVRAPFLEAEWDLATMEPKSGRYPGQTAPMPQEHLSARDLDSRGGVK
ncbi:pectate lyase family protein [Sphingopyxis sp. 113P3]|jgi:Pectate lyase|uniref:pectate lyase family protein n=1 Tax=Sphingopyxis sp. (strain 113P3) TaxID=292913 RepID=UPI0006AD5ABD|nr:pectate lyase [Sphingopyxis sp. 113P3]ALC14005.1 pectate lyase [Sphingopyxis sp. 113P3]